MNTGTLKTYSAVYLDSGAVRHLWFEAEGPAQAREKCLQWSAGLEGEANRPAADSPLPAAYDATTSRRLLGNISRTSLYRMLIRGDLERLPHNRRLLITRSSIERHCR
jgi:hypothetical protein